MAGLTKQHFKAIAEIIKKDIVSNFYISSENQINIFLDDLCNYLKTQNPLFNENQFKKACLE